MRIANKVVMPHLKPLLQITSKIVDTAGNLVDEKGIDTAENFKIKGKEISRNAGRRYARELGLSPAKNLESELKYQLTELIIGKVQEADLRHIEVGNIVRVSRPKITRILNRNLQGVSLGFLLRLASSLGVQMRVDFF